MYKNNLLILAIVLGFALEISSQCIATITVDKTIICDKSEVTITSTGYNNPRYFMDLDGDDIHDINEVGLGTGSPLTITWSEGPSGMYPFYISVYELGSGSACASVALTVNPGEASAPGFWEIPSGTQSFGEQGDNSNTILTVGGSPVTDGARLIGIGWDVTITTLGSSFHSDVSIGFGPYNSATEFSIIPGEFDGVTGPMTRSYNSGGILDLISAQDSFTVPDGIVQIEFYETFDDVADAADADISGTLYLEFDLCGESLCTKESLTYDGTDTAIADKTRERVNDKIVVTATIGNVNVPAPNDVDLRASNYISIEKDFETLLGAKLLLDIESCVKLDQQVPPPFLSNEDVEKKAKVELQTRQFRNGEQANRGAIRRAVSRSKKE